MYARLGRLLKEVQFGGDVKVLVRQARGLLSVGKGMQLFAQVNTAFIRSFVSLGEWARFALFSTCHYVPGIGFQHCAAHGMGALLHQDARWQPR